MVLRKQNNAKSPNTSRGRLPIALRSPTNTCCAFILKPFSNWLFYQMIFVTVLMDFRYIMLRPCEISLVVKVVKNTVSGNSMLYSILLIKRTWYKLFSSIDFLKILKLCFFHWHITHIKAWVSFFCKMRFWWSYQLIYL